MRKDLLEVDAQKMFGVSYSNNIKRFSVNNNVGFRPFFELYSSNEYFGERLPI